VSLWTLAAGAGYSAVPLNLKIIFAKIDAVGYNTALPLFILFAIYHASLEEWGNKKWLHALLFLISISNILLIVTNELHVWVWAGFSPVEGNVVVFEHGPGFVWVASTGYLMIASLLVILWLASRKGPEISRKQSRLLLYASLFPIIANIFYLYEIKGTEGVDWSSVTFSVTGFLFLRAIYGTRLLDLVPVARDRLFSSLSDGMIVLDTQNRIIDINQAAADMIASTPALLLGKDFTGVTPLARSFLEEPPEQEIKTELGVGIPNKLYFDVRISPLREEPKKIIGRLITFRDITERKENRPLA
jgi:PAS domain S-box-containing protein